jgi:hypothetical protein
MDKNHINSLKRRCPRLGGPVTFEYCKTAGEKLPQCHKIGTGAIPYQYKIEIEPVGYYDKSDEKRFFHITFISPLKNDGAKPKFKIGDRIKIKGWIESF